MAAHIAIFLPRFGSYGGAEGFGQRLASGLAQRGHEVTFVCARQETEAPPGVNVRVVGRRGGSRAGKMLWFASRCERLRPEFDLTVGLGKTWRQDLLRVGGAPLRSFWQLSDRAWPAGPRRLWKQARRRLAPANRLALRLEAAQLASARRIVAVSHLVRGLLLEQHPQLSPQRIEVIYNEPDPQRFSLRPPPDAPPLRRILGLGPIQRPGNTNPDDGVLLGFAGSNFRLKGLATLLQAMAELPDSFHLAVAGGRDPYAYAAQARKLGLEGRVHFLGPVEDMPGFYHALDVFALPSFYDACANAVLEARACGVAAVSSTTNGSSAALERRFVVPPGEPQKLAQALQEAVHHPPAPGLQWPENTRRGLEPVLDEVEALLQSAPGRE